MYQESQYIGTKVFHENYEKEEMCGRIVRMMTVEFGQAQIITKQESITILSNKKGLCTIRRRQEYPKDDTQIRQAQENMDSPILSHNRKKRYILEEGTYVPFLGDLGIMSKDGKVVRAKYDKFRQVNRYLEFIEDILPELPVGREIVIVDFGCGKSYLTFAMYYYLKVIKQCQITIIGLDLKEDVIRRCQKLSQTYGYDHLQFLQGDIASYEGVDQVDMVVSLHACDTATDHALAKAVRWGAKVIFAVPCCQHELNHQIQNDLLEPLLSYGIIKERMAALLTDALRAQYLEGEGYRTQLLEFIDMEHTPKNIMLRSIFKGKRADNSNSIEKILQTFHIDPALGRLLADSKAEID